MFYSSIVIQLTLFKDLHHLLIFVFCVSTYSYIVLWYGNYLLINFIVNCQSISCVWCVKCAVVNYVLVYVAQSAAITKDCSKLVLQ